MKIEAEYNEYFRGALSDQSSYAEVDQTKVTEWVLDRAEAIRSAASLLRMYGTSKNYHIQRRIMFVDQAAAENARRRAILDGGDAA